MHTYTYIHRNIRVHILTKIHAYSFMYTYMHIYVADKEFVQQALSLLFCVLSEDEKAKFSLAKVFLFTFLPAIVHVYIYVYTYMFMYVTLTYTLLFFDRFVKLLCLKASWTSYKPYRMIRFSLISSLHTS